MSHLLEQLVPKDRRADLARSDAALFAFQVSIKRGPVTRVSFQVMGPDSMTVAERHECMCERGEYVTVRPAQVRA